MSYNRKPVYNKNTMKSRQTSSRKKKHRKAFKIFLLIFLAISCATTGAVCGTIIGYVKTASPITPEQLKLSNFTTFVYDDTGENVIAQLSQNENRVWADYDEIPQYMKDAFVAIEDERFFDHEGVDIIGLFRAVFNKITHPTRPMQGASTITMQVVKNITGEDQRSIQRKVQEQWKAMQLEKKMTKWEILELYMNIINLGQNIYGVQSAARAYFNKDVSELTLAECASIAGITNNPSLYNPFTTKGRENNKKRQIDILNKMLELGKITRQQYEEAVNEKLEFADSNSSEVKNISKQSYFVDQVVLDVKKGLMAQGMTENLALNMIYNGGLKIYTTLDSDVQKAVDEVFTDSNNFPVANPSNPHPQAAIVIIDPSNGQVKAMYGGYGEKKGNTLNRATQIQRQPGSSIKPIAIYGPAINEKLVTAATVIDDSPAYMLGVEKGLYPKNFDNTYKGLQTIRDSIRQSLNVVAAKLWRDVIGPEIPLQYLKKVGISRTQRNVSLALGGLEEGVSPLQMAAAYTPFVNKGLYYQPITYAKVEDQYGNVLLENKEIKPVTVYDEEAAYIMNSMLQDVCTSGTAAGYGTIKNAKGETIPTGGKTGTTSENIDKWFVGFSPYYVAATWYGYDLNTQIPAMEQNQALNLWNKVMTKIHSNLAAKEFSKPTGIVYKEVCTRSGELYTELCRQDPMNRAQGIAWAPIRTEMFIKGTEPKNSCSVHVIKTVCSRSADLYGRSVLANSNCPSSDMYDKIFIHRKNPYYPVTAGAPFPEDFIYDYTEGEYCSIH